MLIVDLNFDGFIPAMFVRKEKSSEALRKTFRFVSIIVKSYSSAHKGCLDVRYRRRTYGAAISSGELLTKL
jgi:hypothetical protein